MIKAEKLLKVYGTEDLKLTVLKNLDLEIKKGEFVAIIGPSGAGKSTLMYQLSLLDEPTGGEVYLDNIKTSGLNQIQKTKMRLEMLGYVFQDYALLPELTSVENIMLPMLMQGIHQRVARDRAEEALARIDMDDKVDGLPSQLSGGQQQRVSIARAIAHHPKILFADEPTANLDTMNGKLVMDAFSALHDEGQTIVMVTHEAEYAKQAHRVIALRDGEIVADEFTDHGSRSESVCHRKAHAAH
ncbi:MAG: ABC transporter ATP-binding protein [Candidatus Liptonbacteria bacterium]